MARQFQLDGHFYWVKRNRSGLVVAEGVVRNRIMNVFLNAVLNAIRGTALNTTWYAGLISASGYSAISADDTMSSHAGWTELTNYGANRITVYSPSSPAASGQEITNTTAAVFTATTSGTIKGVFLTDGSTAGATTNTLMAAAELTANQSLSPGETYSLTHRLQASSGA